MSYIECNCRFYIVIENILQQRALERYEAVCQQGAEKLVSGSDDFTLFLWLPEKEKRPLARMTGHQQLINDVKFSPDTRYRLATYQAKGLALGDLVPFVFETMFILNNVMTIHSYK